MQAQGRRWSTLETTATLHFWSLDSPLQGWAGGLSWSTLISRFGIYLKGQWAGFFWKMTVSVCENVILIHLALSRSPFSQLTWLTKRREVFVRKSEQTRKRQSRRQWKHWARLKPELEVQLSSEKITSLKPAYFPSGEMTAFTGRSWALFATENEGASRVKNWPCTYHPVWRWSFWSQLTRFSFGFCCCFNV